MRKNKRKYYAFRKYWRRYWRWRIFAEVFYPTKIITPSELGIKINLSDIGKNLEA